MHQIVLIDRAAAELSQIDKLNQMDVETEFTRLSKQPDQTGKESISEIRKGDRTIYRCRFKDYRIYFEKKGDQLVIYHILHGNTLRDFFVRSNLDIHDEEEFEESAKFWKFIEQKRMKTVSDGITL